MEVYIQAAFRNNLKERERERDFNFKLCKQPETYCTELIFFILVSFSISFMRYALKGSFQQTEEHI